MGFLRLGCSSKTFIEYHFLVNWCSSCHQDVQGDFNLKFVFSLISFTDQGGPCDRSSRSGS